jgi:predicted Zn finger-like uncharacterized protein
MKVKCPDCETEYKIDISKIPVSPEGGITTTCPRCKGKIPLNPYEEPKIQERHDQLIPCPECGHVNISTKICINCGRVFSKEEIENLEIPVEK